MKASPHPKAPPTFDACNRFFSIDELLTLFLESAPPLVLLHCQRVCRKWNHIIADSTLLQQNLFLEPSDADEPPRLNPILWQVFGPLLATPAEPHHSAAGTVYEDLSNLPWARDGASLDALSPLVFAREEASWRRMYISQPPIDRLDWWHTWSVIEQPITSPSETPQGGSGWGHQDLTSTPLTLGLLWDLLESRLYRGCEARISYFPQGQAPEDDETAGDDEREWARDPSSIFRVFDADVARVRLTTHQRWKHRPRVNEAFDLVEREWVVREGLGRNHDHEGDGFNVLRHDCRRDFGEVTRWSRCEGFSWAEIHGESSMSR